MAKLDTGGPGTLLAMSQPSILDLVNFGPNGWGQALAAGATMTILIALAGFFIGGLIGTAGAWAKISGGPAVRFAAETYTTVLRGIPDLLVIYLFYFGGSAALGAIARLFGAEGFIGMPAFITGVLAIGVVSGAYQAEVFRGAFNTISRGELEAARSVGMGTWLRFRRIIAPQVLRYAIPGLGNTWQLVLKESALISVTGLVELLRQSQIAAGSTSRPFDFYITAAALYLVITAASSYLFRQAEARSMRGVRRA